MMIGKNTISFISFFYFLPMWCVLTPLCLLVSIFLGQGQVLSIMNLSNETLVLFFELKCILSHPDCTCRLGTGKPFLFGTHILLPSNHK